MPHVIWALSAILNLDHLANPLKPAQTELSLHIPKEHLCQISAIQDEKKNEILLLGHFLTYGNAISPYEKLKHDKFKMASKITRLRGKCTEHVLWGNRSTTIFVFGFFTCDFRLAR